MSSRPCHSCGAVLDAEARFCARCGTPVTAQPPSPPPPYSRPPAPQPVVVELPNWVTTDWAYPAKAALGTIAIGLIGLAVLTGLLVVASAIASQLSPFPTKGVLSFAPTAWLSFHGAVESDGLSMTGIAWIAVATMLSRRLFLRTTRPHSGATAQQAVWLGAAKAAVVYGAAMLALAFADRALIGDFGEIGFFAFGGARINPAAAFFLGAVAGFLGGVWMLLRAYDLSLAHLFGLNVTVRLPESARASLAGLRRVLFIGIGGMVALVYVAFVVELGSSGRSFGAAQMLATAVQGLVLIALGGIDMGWGWFVYGTRFFAGNLSIPNVLFVTKPGWIYIGIVIPVVAMLAGGMAAAKRLTERTQQRAIETGAFIAVELMVFGLIAGLFWTRLGGGFVAASMFLPALWAVLAVIGAVLTVQGAVVPPQPVYAPPPPQPWSSQPQPPATATATATVACAACGTANAAGNRFCESCGAAL